jgi:hypothetical protein
MDSPEKPSSFQRQRAALKQELIQVRRASLLATEKGDYRTVAQLTIEAARLNQALVVSQVEEELR